MVRRWIGTRLPCKDGPTGLFHPPPGPASVLVTGRCEPRRFVLVMCRGERSREARCLDPPSSGLLRLSGRPDCPRSRAAEQRYAGHMVRTVLLASPRGYCAGVERAVETVETALDLYGSPA